MVLRLPLYLFHMTPPKKPEWIQIADTDNAASVRKVSKALPVIALGSALMIIGAGVVFAQSNNEAPAAAVESVVASVQPAAQNSLPASRNVTAATPSMRARNVNAQKNVISVASKAAAVAPKAPGIQNPIGRGEDNEEDDDRISVAPRSRDGGIARPRGGEHEDREHEDGEDD